MQHTFSFHIASKPNGVLGFAPLIDGMPLIDRVAQYESEMGYTPTGGYGGLIPSQYNCGPLDRYFLGQSSKAPFCNAPGEIAVLGCKCGEVGCWPLACTVIADGDTITWRRFRQPHRRSWTYEGFGPFVFRRVEYELALKQLRQNIEV
jgi:hypothetical protein